MFAKSRLSLFTAGSALLLVNRPGFSGDSVG